MSLLGALTRRIASPPDAKQAEPAPVMTMPAPPTVIALPPPRERRPRHDLRHISPRRFAEITHELYVEGSLKWAEYQLVGFPSELHPAYDTTIGALTGQKAEPNRPRDLLAEWENRLDFMRRHADPAVLVAERALDVLRRQAEPRA
ncbi:MAG: hypothetical protein NVV74_12455 [Magnetospirillum sp.]|nr:hypothetical protein [Magnetospirillum sp.]